MIHICTTCSFAVANDITAVDTGICHKCGESVYYQDCLAVKTESHKFSIAYKDTGDTSEFYTFEKLKEVCLELAVYNGFEATAKGEWQNNLEFDKNTRLITNWAIAVPESDAFLVCQEIVECFSGELKISDKLENNT